MDLTITDADLPSLAGKHAVVTGGSSGIGLATVQLLAAKGAAAIHVLDIQQPRTPMPSPAAYRECDVSSWPALLDAFATFTRVDLVFANAGRGQGGDPFALVSDPATGRLVEPCAAVIAANFRGPLNTAVLAVRAMRAHGEGGRIVFTSSATGLSVERYLPVYAALKLGVIGLVRGWRCQLIHEGITVNAVAPACTQSGLMPADVAARLAKEGLQVSPPEHVAKALVFSAVATEKRRVEAYGAELEEDNEREGPWNGRVILTIGDRYAELEEPIERLKPQWFGEQNWRDTRYGQKITEGLFNK